MRCAWARKRLARYADADIDLGPVESALLRLHLARCPDCHARYERLEVASAMLGALPRPRPSNYLETAILSALSVEVLRRNQPGLRWHRRKLKLSNLMRPLAVPVVGGMLLALVLVPALLSSLWVTPIAYADDIPLRFLAKPIVTAPVMVMRSPYPVDRDFTVLAYIDSQGEVYDYQVAHDETLDARMLGQLGNALLTSRFEPAQRFGQPTLGRAVILFQRIESMA